MTSLETEESKKQPQFREKALNPRRNREKKNQDIVLSQNVIFSEFAIGLKMRQWGLLICFSNVEKNAG